MIDQVKQVLAQTARGAATIGKAVTLGATFLAGVGSIAAGAFVLHPAAGLITLGSLLTGGAFAYVIGTQKAE